MVKRNRLIIVLGIAGIAGFLLWRRFQQQKFKLPAQQSLFEGFDFEAGGQTKIGEPVTGEKAIVRAENILTGLVEEMEITTPAEGVEFINRVLLRGDLLQRTTQTVGQIAPDTVIAELMPSVFRQVSVRQVEQDEFGLSPTDKLILSSLQKKDTSFTSVPVGFEEEGIVERIDGGFRLTEKGKAL